MGSINVVRVYNVHETEPVGFSYGGSYYLFQPKKGAFKREIGLKPTEIVRANRFNEKETHIIQSPYEKIVKVDDRAVKNYLDVPGELADWLKTGQGQNMTRGLLKTERELGASHETEVELLERKKAALEVELKAMEEHHDKRLVEIEAQTATKAAQSVQNQKR